MKISIGTLSRAFDLSDEALRFYEKKGLLQPKRDEDSGYRTFERADIQRVANIRRLKNQNFSLDEIHSVYYCIDEKTLQSLYEEKAADSRRQILYHQHILAHTEDAISTLSHMPELLNQPQLFSAGVAYLLEYPSIEVMWARLPKNPILKHLFHQLPLTSFTTLIAKDSIGKAQLELTKGVLFFDADADVLGMDLSQFRKIDAARAVSTLFRLEDGVFDVDLLISWLTPFLKDHRLKLTDDLFTSQLISYIDGEEHPVHYARLIAPVTDL